jgi:sigma-B regulation protein RsbU (phosphoserine phosphatase)
LCGKFKNHFATAAYVFADMEKQSMSYAAAGHPPLLLWRMSTGRASEVSENGLPLGLLSAATYSAVEVPVEPGDKAILYTDGIPETTSPSEPEFGADLFKGFLESNHNLKADTFADSLLDELSGWLSQFRGSLELRDRLQFLERRRERISETPNCPRLELLILGLEI